MVPCCVLRVARSVVRGLAVAASLLFPIPPRHVGLSYGVLLNATFKRRWLGALVLLAAIGMLVVGQTVLDKRITGIAFAIYWLACFGLTGTAIIIAYLDARAGARRICNEEREMLNTALRQIQSDARNRPRRRADPSNN
jgi:hypothetical protein